MAQEENDGDMTYDFWWTHRLFSEEAAALMTAPSAGAEIAATINDIKEKARELLRVAVSSNGNGNNNNNNNNNNNEEEGEMEDSARFSVWNKEVAALRERLLRLLIASHEEQQERLKDERSGKGDVVVKKEEMTQFRKASYEMLLGAVVGEWWAQGTGDGSLAPESLLDTFLDGVVFLHASTWNGDEEKEKDGGITMKDVVWAFVTDVWGMTAIEQEKWLPRFVQHAWESFLAELKELEEEVLRVCTPVLCSSSEATAESKQDAARMLVARAVRVMKMLAVPQTTLKTAVSKTTTSPRPHVVVATATKARTLVESIGRWFPVCCKYISSLAPSQDEENENEKKTVSAAEVSEWVRALRMQMERVLSLLAQLDETSPWIVILVNVISGPLYIMTDKEKPRPVNDQSETDISNVDSDDMLQRTALKAFLSSYEKKMTPTTSSSSHWTLVEACNTKMSHVLSCALDETGAPSTLSTRVLRVLLVQRPIATLQYLLNFLCPSNNVAASCDFEGVITDKGSSHGARGTAFLEEPLKGNSVAKIFFPKYFSVFQAVEEALASLCKGMVATSDGDASVDSVSSPLERFFAATMDEAFVSFSSSKGVAASEWVMFLAFICSDTPLFEVSTLSHVRSAARRFFAPGRSMISYLHEHIVRHQRYGLTAFFLPPLRAIGVDYSTCSDHEHLSCALRYPLSAEVAYFQELPRGYYSRQPLRLALNAVNDALNFFHVLLMPQMSGGKSSKKTLSAAAGGGGEAVVKGENDAVVVRDLFLDIVAHVGVIVTTRARGDDDRRVAVDLVTLDALSSFFFGVLRLCSSVTYWSTDRRHEVQRDIIKQMQVHSSNNNNNNNNNNSTTTAGSSVTRAGPSSKHGGGKLNQIERKKSLFPMEFLLRGGCTLEEKDMDEVKTVADVGEVVWPHAWYDWFCNAEFEDIDGRAGAAAMALLRVCNRHYMKYIPTKTLLGRRDIIEQHARRKKETCFQEKMQTEMEACIHQDVRSLHRIRSGKDTTQSKYLKQQQKSSLETTTTTAVVTAHVVEDVIKAGKDKNGADENEEEAKNNIEHVHTTVPAANEQGEKKEEEEEKELDEYSENPLSLAAVRPYIEVMMTTLVQRARISVVDGVAAGVALKKWLMAVTGLFEPHCLFETLRLVVLRANGMLRKSTKLECTSLSAFLGVITDDIALPYKESFLLPHMKASQQGGQNVMSSETEKNEKTADWIRRTLPNSEKEAGQLLHLLIADSTHFIVNFLEQATPLGDWKAYALTLHMRRVLGLVRKYETQFRTAVTKRQQKMMGTNSVNGDGAAYPVQLLSAVECPLLGKMVGPAMDVNHLFKSVLPPPPPPQQQQQQQQTAPVSFLTPPVSQKHPMGNNFGDTGRRGGWSASASGYRKRRHRSPDNFYAYRHGHRRNEPRGRTE